MIAELGQQAFGSKSMKSCTMMMFKKMESAWRGLKICG